MALAGFFLVVFVVNYALHHVDISFTWAKAPWKDVPVLSKESLQRESMSTAAVFTAAPSATIGVAETSMKGSGENRMHNITTGVEKVNGVVVYPGEEFSLITALQPLTEEGGYVKEYVINNAQSVKELGGGLCQVSTTLFNAVLDAGLPVTERRAHSYLVSYYQPGLDATVYDEDNDFKFLNDTNAPVEIKAQVEGDTVSFEIIGVPDGRVASSSVVVIATTTPPAMAAFVSLDLLPGEYKCVERPRHGLQSESYYDVTYADGTTKHHVFGSTYKPWQEVCFFGIAPWNAGLPMAQNFVSIPTQYLDPVE